MLTSDIKAVIYDFDGVIVSSKVAEYKSWSRVFRAYDCRLGVRKWIRIIANPMGEFDPARILFDECRYRDKINIEDVKYLRRNLYESLRRRLSPLPGILKLIKQCLNRGLLLGLASNGLNEKISFHLQRMKIASHFNAIKCFDDVGRKKPAPDIYEALLKELKLKPSEAIVIEDSPPGISAAKEAGIFCVAVPNSITKYLDLSRADKVIPGLKGISLESLLETFQ